MLPQLIQGGMGVGVSGWRLAREVSSLGQLGVVSGTALDTTLVRRLAKGDLGGDVRRAIAAFPAAERAQVILERYLRRARRTGEGADHHGRRATNGTFESASSPTPDPDEGARYKLIPLPRATLTPEREWLLILANFVEVYLAKEGHGGIVGINYLHKIQFPILPSLYGAMLAGVDFVLMGAGIPAEIPEVLDRLSRHEAVSVPLDTLGASDDKPQLRFDPTPLLEELGAPALNRPRFLVIVASSTLARALLKKAPGGIDGFIVEAPIAGGHNAPPRGSQQLSHRGEPIYGKRDAVDAAQMAALGVPFWLAGGCASRERLHAALAAGGQGVQVGTAFAFCEESGLDPTLRHRLLRAVLRGEADVFTDPAASPTSFPFKVASLAGTLSEPVVYGERIRLCDLGYLRRAYRKPDGTVDYRCPAEPVADYVRKGGAAEETIGRKCLCNSLVANIGLGQRRADGYEEPPLLTAGDDIDCVRPFITDTNLSYHARDVIAAMLPAE